MDRVLADSQPARSAHAPAKRPAEPSRSRRGPDRPARPDRSGRPATARKKAAAPDRTAAQPALPPVVRSAVKPVSGPLPAMLLGRMRVNRRGEAKFHPDDPSIGPLDVGPAHLGGALNGDRVEVQPLPVPGTGRVLEVVQPARKSIVGTFTPGPHGDRVIPDDGRLPGEVHVVGHGRFHPTPGDKVVVALLPNEVGALQGEVIEVLGPPDGPGVDMLAIIRAYDLPGPFPAAVLAEARAFGDEVDPADHAGRVDCREHPVVTIDPDDARDFDDAICVKREANGTWRLWVHIADVSHYVAPGSAMDVEASQRGNSTYLVDRVIPMLPEALSNELCSLKPHVDRLTKCVEFHLSRECRVMSARFYPALIHSHRRHTYAEALAVLEAKGRPADPLSAMLKDANELAQQLRRDRFAHGSLDLDFPEKKIRLDTAGRVLRVDTMENDISHQLIEEFMLLANEAVAKELGRLKRPAVYRIHEPPDPERLAEYGEEIRAQRITCGDLTQRGEIGRLLKRLKDHPSGPALKVGLLRSLKRARYSPESLGHFGLAKAHYTHFTSPIRRYADLLVHRSLFGVRDARLTAATLAHTADHISETERRSGDAEQDSKQVKLMTFLQEQITTRKRSRYDAVVHEMRRAGFFVEVKDLGLRGMVLLRDCKDDFYQWNPAKHALIGQRHKRVIRMGDTVEVVAARVDPQRRLVDFTLA